jgi:hypothetical protein
MVFAAEVLRFEFDDQRLDAHDHVAARLYSRNVQAKIRLTGNGRGSLIRWPFRAISISTSIDGWVKRSYFATGTRSHGEKKNLCVSVAPRQKIKE